MEEMRYWESARTVSREAPGRRTLSRKRIVLGAAAAAVVAAGAAVALWSGIFIITDVQFFGGGTIPQDSLKRIRASLVGKNLATGEVFASIHGNFYPPKNGWECVWLR